MSQRLNSGVLRKNERKEGVEARPDFKGQINVGGTEYWISGWNKTNDRGAFVSLAVERIEGSREPITIGDPGPKPHLSTQTEAVPF